MNLLEKSRFIKKRVRKFLSKIKHTIIIQLEDARYFRYLGVYNPKNIYVIGTPMHSNVGDNAIAFAEMLFLESCGIAHKNIKEITVDEYTRYEKVIVRHLQGKRKLICLHGGGNMGNQWLNEELFRRHVMSQLKKNPMVILPQTFSYSEDEEGRNECRKSVPYYNGRENLTITAREKFSYDLLRKSYPDTRIILTPDIVLSMNPEVLGIRKKERKGVLFVFRKDGERVTTDEETFALQKMVQNCQMEYRMTDMLSDLDVQKESRRELIAEKLNEFAASELVITDRLHAMVFAAISETPCIVMKNNNHKIIGTYDWIQEYPYIRFAENVEDVQNHIEEMKKCIHNKYDYAMLNSRFDDLRKAVNQYRNK